MSNHDDDDGSGSGWLRLCPANVGKIVAIWLDIGLDTLRAELAGDATITGAEREALVAKARPVLKAFDTGWFASRVTPAAEPPTCGVVH